MMKVGWVGLGAMGAPMAACAAHAGHEISAFDIDPGRIVELSADRVSGVGSVAEAAAADALVLMVATGEQGEDVLFGSGAAASVLRPGATVIVMATVGPANVISWARRLSERGVQVIDAPVSGGSARAATGDLLIMVAGPEAEVQRVRPLVDAMAASAPLVGSQPGDGQKVKLVNQLLCGVHITAAAEALAFAEAIGIEPASCREVIRTGAGASFMLDDRGERMVTGAFTDPRSALDIFVKDMGLVTDAARESGFEVPLATTSARLFDAGSRAGLGRLDDSAIIEILRAPR